MSLQQKVATMRRGARKQKKSRSRFSFALCNTPALDDDEPASAVQVYSQTVCQERELSYGLPCHSSRN